MLIFYEGFSVEVFFIESRKIYGYQISLPDSDFFFWDYCQPKFDNFSHCLKASLNACMEIIHDHDEHPDFIQPDDSWDLPAPRSNFTLDCCTRCGKQSLFRDFQHVPEIKCANCGAITQSGITCPLLYKIVDELSILEIPF